MCQESNILEGCVSPKEIINLIKKWLKKATIVLAARCSIEYEGRATSQATKAERLIIIKEDGTLLIHEGRGRNPLNWQPKAHIIAETNEDRAIIRALRIHPKERLTIMIEGEVHYLIASLERGKFILEGSEESVRNRIALNPSLIEKGAVLVSREVSTPHGRIDVILRDKKGSLILVEVKRSTAEISAVYQLKRYVEYYSNLGINVKGVIASPTISPRAEKLLKKYRFKHIPINP